MQNSFIKFHKTLNSLEIILQKYLKSIQKINSIIAIVHSEDKINHKIVKVQPNLFAVILFIFSPTFLP